MRFVVRTETIHDKTFFSVWDTKYNEFATESEPCNTEEDAQKIAECMNQYFGS